MSKFHRWTGLALLVLFVPALMLASLSIVLCVGDRGHVAVEMEHRGDSHPHIAAAKTLIDLETIASADTDTVIDQNDCVDFWLAVDVRMPDRSSVVTKSATSTYPTGGGIAVISASQPANFAPALSFVRQSAVSWPDPRLLMRASTVLRI